MVVGEMVGGRGRFGDDVRIAGGQVQLAGVALDDVVGQDVPDADADGGADGVGRLVVGVLGVRVVVADDKVAGGEEALLLRRGKVEVLRVGDWGGIED